MTSTDQYREYLDKQVERMLVDMDDMKSWKFHSEKDGVKAYNRVEGSLTATLGVGHIPFNPRAVWDLIMDVTRNQLFDKQIVVGKRLKELDPQTMVDYLEYKGRFFVAGRDFLTIAHWRVQPDGTILIVAYSIEDQALCPHKEPKIVRGHLHIAGWRIVPNADYTGCDVTFMANTDLKGSIPARVSGVATVDQPYLIHEVAQVLKNDKSINRFDALGKLTNIGTTASM